MTPLFKKLNFKDHATIVITQARKGMEPELAAMSKVTKVKTDWKGAKEIEFFLGFVTLQKEVDAIATKVAPLIAPDGLLWLAYPKGTSKNYTCEFNRDTGWTELGKAGFEPVRMVAIDADWSALRFRRAENIKKMTRSFAMTEIGKKKVKAAKKKK